MNELLNRLKNSINAQVFNKVNVSIMEQYKFVPLNIKEGFLFTAAGTESNQSSIEAKLKEFFSEPVKFIQISDQDLSDLIKMHQPAGGASAEYDAHAKIGELLLQKGYITDVQLLQALAESKKEQVPVGSVFFKMGFITLQQLKEVLRMQNNYEMVTPEMLSGVKDVIHLLPEDFIKTHRIIPLSSDGKKLNLGVVRPIKPDVVKEIIYLTGQNPKQYLMTYFEFENTLNSFFNAHKQATHKAIKEIEGEAEQFTQEASLWEQVDTELQESTGAVAKFVNQIITTAINTKVSDIHIEPCLSGYQVRYRKDGMLQKMLEIPVKIESQIIARFKVLARMNIAEHRRPQDGTFSIKHDDCLYDFRINTLPVGTKEKVVIRVLAPAVSLNASDKNINLMGGTQDDVEKIRLMTSCPNGIILTSGPTGSGKTTTLYSVLKSLNEEHVNITTIEDPIEIRLEGVNQSQINPKAGITFASCMRAILRQDPDIILVGEIRDYETLEIAISAALTGHLVLSTVHTNSAAATITRLIEMGAKDYLVASTLSGVIAQRLVRKLCDDCKEEYHATHEEASRIILSQEGIDDFVSKPIYRAIGCNNCNFTGYKGRLGVYEIMSINKEIRRLIATGAHDIDIEDTAMKNGMITLQQSCLNHIIEGSTTINEFIRVLGMAGD